MKTIIVPIDFSEYSEYALQTAAILAKKFDSNLIGLHMVDLSSMHAYGEETTNEHTEKALYYIKLAEKRLGEFIQRDYLNGISITTIIRHFEDFDELGGIALDNKADLIVMGSKGASGFTEFFIGSNTERVVRTSKIPVLVIKNNPANWDLKKVVFAIDLSDYSLPAYKVASDFLNALHIDLEFLYVKLPGDGFSDETERDEAVRGFLQNIDGNLNRLENVKYIEDKTPEKGILKYAHLANADMVAIITHGRTGLAHLFEGSISEDLANNADFPVMTFQME